MVVRASNPSTPEVEMEERIETTWSTVVSYRSVRAS